MVRLDLPRIPERLTMNEGGLGMRVAGKTGESETPPLRQNGCGQGGDYVRCWVLGCDCLRQAQGRIFGGLGCCGLCGSTRPSDRLRGGSPRTGGNSGWRVGGRRAGRRRRPYERLDADGWGCELGVAGARKTGGSQTPPLPKTEARTAGDSSEAWVLWALWFDTRRRGRRPGSPRTVAPASTGSL